MHAIRPNNKPITIISLNIAPGRWTNADISYTPAEFIRIASWVEASNNCRTFSPRTSKIRPLDTSPEICRRRHLPTAPNLTLAAMTVFGGGGQMADHSVKMIGGGCCCCCCWWCQANTTSLILGAFAVRVTVLHLALTMDVARTLTVVLTVLLICYATSSSNSLDDQLQSTDVPGITRSEATDFSSSGCVFFYLYFMFYVKWAAECILRGVVVQVLVEYGLLTDDL